VSVSMDGPDSVAEVRPYVRRMGYTYPIVVDEDGSIAQRLNPIGAAPFSILVGRDGKVIRRFSGFKAGEAPLLEGAIVAALNVSAAPAPTPAPAEDTSAVPSADAPIVDETPSVTDETPQDDSAP